MFRSIPVDKILKEIAVNIAGGERNITLHSEDFLRYGSTSLLPNEDKVLNLLNTVVRIPDINSISIDFVTASTALSNPKLVKTIGDMLGLSDRNPSIIQMGIESASPRIIKIIAPGKPKPFNYEEWPKIVEEAIALLNDSGWWVCATIIVDLPQETEEDIEMNMKLIERLERYNVFIFPLPFIPSGSLRRTKNVVDTYKIASTRNLELIALAVYDAIKKLNQYQNILLRKHLLARGKYWEHYFMWLRP